MMISIIMSSYNAEKYIQTSIDSVTSQSYSNWELVIIDDGSQDQTREIIKEYKDPRIRFFYQENRGVSAARNLGLKHISGDYYCFLDADDFMPQKSLENRFKVYQNNPEAEFVDGAVHIYDRALQNKRSEWIPSHRGNPLDELISLSGKCFFGPTWMIKRNRDRVYQFHEGLTHGEDLLFYIELALHGGEYDFTDNVILHYRKGHPSAMQNLNGLEKGYRYIYRTLLNHDQISPEKAEIFKKKAKSIMLKSYLGRIKPYHALLSQIKKW